MTFHEWKENMGYWVLEVRLGAMVSGYYDGSGGPMDSPPVVIIRMKPFWGPERPPAVIQIPDVVEVTGIHPAIRVYKACGACLGDGVGVDGSACIPCAGKGWRYATKADCEARSKWIRAEIEAAKGNPPEDGPEGVEFLTADPSSFGYTPTADGQ